MQLTKDKILSFQSFIWQFYHTQGRSFAWRNINNPYCILVSEIMLQQTQTYRVTPKYEQFIELFPNFIVLAHAPLRHVLAAWQGLGYNRRGKYLQEIAQKVMCEFEGQLPNDQDVLKTFPGIGPNTAGSICAFAFNMPVVFIETNIRAVFLHSFFRDKQDVHDKELLPLISATLDYNNPREWYYALMDYGVLLKKMHPNPSRNSKHHAIQTKFEGSDRQIRGNIIKILVEQQIVTKEQLLILLKQEEQRINTIITQLSNDGLIKQEGNQLYI